MTKIEFLSVLRGRITGSIPHSEVEAQLDYYSAYIDGRIGAGLTEEEAVAELGDPLLIAKTVIESTDRAAEAAGYDGPYRASTDTYADSDGINSGIFGNSGPDPYQDPRPSGGTHSSYTQDGREDQGGANEKGSSKGGLFTAGSLGCVIGVIVVVLVIALIWVILRFVIRLSFGLLGWSFPAVVVAGIVVLIILLARRR